MFDEIILIERVFFDPKLLYVLLLAEVVDRNEGIEAGGACERWRSS